MTKTEFGVKVLELESEGGRDDMKRAMIGLAALLLVTVVRFGWAQEVPRLQFDKTTYDFGEVQMVSSLTGIFTFQNAGTAELVIQKPEVSCGCTVAGVKPNKLAPGQKGELEFTLKVTGVRGRIEKTITVPSNDPQNPRILLTLKANVKQVIEVLPALIGTGNLDAGTRTNYTVRVKRTDGKDLVIERVEKSGNTIQVEPHAVEGDSHTVDIAVTLDAQGPRRIAEWFRFYVAGQTQAVATVHLIGTAVGDVLVNPETLFWSVPSAANWPGPQAELQTLRKIEIITAKPNVKVNLREPVSNLDGLKLELKTVQPGRHYTITANLLTAPKQSVFSKISVKTDSAIQPNVEIPVTVRVFQP